MSIPRLHNLRAITFFHLFIVKWFFRLLVSLRLEQYLRPVQVFSARLASISILSMFVIAPALVHSSELNQNAVEHQPGQCTLGVFPFISAQALESVFAPIAAELDTVMDCSLGYRSAIDFKDFMRKLKNREFDIALIQPFDYVQIASFHGYITLAAQDEALRAIIVTRLDSDIRDITDLKGKVIAAPPAVAAVSYLARAMLDSADLSVSEDIDLLFTKNHGSCLHKVLIGTMDACVTAPVALRLYEEQNRRKFKVIARSPAIPNILFVVRDDISAEKFQQLQQKILNISLSNGADKLADNALLSQPFRAITDDEYDIVRQYCEKFKPLAVVDDINKCVSIGASEELMQP